LVVNKNDEVELNKISHTTIIENDSRKKRKYINQNKISNGIDCEIKLIK